jgi:hypothetical protein
MIMIWFFQWDLEFLLIKEERYKCQLNFKLIIDFLNFIETKIGFNAPSLTLES